MDWFLPCVVHKWPKPVEPGTGIVDIQFHCGNSDNSEYHFVFAVSPKYYLCYNTPLTTHKHHPQHWQNNHYNDGNHLALSSDALSLHGQASDATKSWDHGFLLAHMRCPLTGLAVLLLIVFFSWPQWASSKNWEEEWSFGLRWLPLQEYTTTK